MHASRDVYGCQPAKYRRGCVSERTRLNAAAHRVAIRGENTAQKKGVPLPTPFTRTGSQKHRLGVAVYW